MSYTTQESGVFENPETYEIELEINNSEIGPGTKTTSIQQLLSSIRKLIKVVLIGLQKTNYPISYPEQNNTLHEYMRLIHSASGYDYNKSKRITSSNFIGPSSYTLQMTNIMQPDETSTIPNIRSGYTVTDKADGDRTIMFISEKGKIYLINTNMQIMFSGAITKNKDVFNTLIDGELILHDKHGKFINLYAAFDIYFLNKKDVRNLQFVITKVDDDPSKSRLYLLKTVIKSLDAASIMGIESPIRIECKKFYPVNQTDSIFAACNYILENEEVNGFD
jgi:hypothetical protein